MYRLIVIRWLPCKNWRTRTVLTFANPGKVLCTISLLERKGVVDKNGTNNVYGTLDDMTFGFSGNKLTSVSNSSEAIAFEGMTGLGKSGTFTKTYDASGRLLTDTSRGITSISYNNDGLPIRVKFSDWSEQEYEWDGMGNHLATTYSGVSYTGKPYTKLVRKYTGDGRVIDNGVEVYERYPGGYLQDSTYCFYVKDYQGNNIAVMDGDKKLIQQTDYYPYGEPWKEPTGQPWLYSGNERLRLDGINEYDFNARRFNSVDGRFSSWDLLSEKRPWESPYSYCGGDPVNFSDPTGLKVQGVTKNDAALLEEDFRAMFPGEVFEKFRPLIIRDGKKHNGKALAPITTSQIEEAFSGITLNDDQRMLVDLVTNVINAPETYKTEYISEGKKISFYSQTVLSPHLQQLGISASICTQENTSLYSVINSLFGEGATIPLKQGALSLIDINNKGHIGSRVSTLGHEIMGHGFYHNQGFVDPLSQHTYSIQLENLILRVMGKNIYRDGTRHAPLKTYISDFNALPPCIR